jgi:sigma-B regulation protein RsbU (phosphoserine phosphatase)
MRLRWRQLRHYLHTRGLMPTSRLAKFTLYLLGVELILLLFSGIMRLAGRSGGVGGWISSIAYLIVFLGAILALRWFRNRIMWALRNRLIVTYMFIGVIPVALLVTMGLLVAYLFIGQFATYVATSDLQMEVRQLDAVNRRLASEIATTLRHNQPIREDILKNADAQEEMFPNRSLTAWYKGRAYMLATSEQGSAPAAKPVAMPNSSNENVATLAVDDHGMSLRAARQLMIGKEPLEVISSVPLDEKLMAKVAERIGVVSVTPADRDSKNVQFSAGNKVRLSNSNDTVNIDANNAGLNARVESPAPLPPPVNWLDREVVFGSTVSMLNWTDGSTQANALMIVHSRPSLMYQRLFRTLGQFANIVLIALSAVAIFFGVIELIALLIGVRLTRTITDSVFKLYRATQHVNKGDFSHRIEVQRHDQLAALETSFNSMTENIQRLLVEQQEKQRLENELTIAQEVQAQLFPKGVFDVRSLELYGYCAPARTVSGDYYDFVPLGPDHLALAVGDISGKGISAALLMATIHSAVRAYSLERAPMMATAGVGHGGSFVLSKADEPSPMEISPSLLCTMLNRQVYHSTALEKYATLFLGVYDGNSHKLTYCNAGHLPPVILAADGTLKRLEIGGSVVGLIDGLTYNEAEVTLHAGDIFVAYSDGITEPENEFGEFGEERLLQVVRENHQLPLQRVADLAVSAVKDWIGAEEQPDDITIVLARLR